MGTFSIWHWLIVLAIVLLIFGTKKLRNLGGDLGSAIKNFKGAMKEDDDPAKPVDAPKPVDSAAPSASAGAARSSSATPASRDKPGV